MWEKAGIELPKYNIREIMFSDRLNVLIDKVEKILKMYWLPENYTPEEYIKLSFFIGGGTRVLLNSEYDEAEQLKVLADIYQKIFNIKVHK